MHNPTGLAERDLLYIANILISKQIHTYNLIGPVEKNLLHITNSFNNSQIYAQNLTRSGKEKFAITSENVEFVRLLTSSSAIIIWSREQSLLCKRCRWDLLFSLKDV